jgi:hypothetical protein
MKNELKLKIDYNLNYSLIAIRSELEDYRFAYFLNKSPFFIFERIKKDICYIINTRKIYFSTFKHINSEFKRTSFLIGNKSIYNSEANETENLFSDNLITNTSFLLPELKEFDYFLKLKGLWKDLEKENLKQYLKNVPYIESATDIDLRKIKSINNLVF